MLFVSARAGGWTLCSGGSRIATWQGGETLRSGAETVDYFISDCEIGMMRAIERVRASIFYSA